MAAFETGRVSNVLNSAIAAVGAGSLEWLVTGRLLTLRLHVI